MFEAFMLIKSPVVDRISAHPNYSGVDIISREAIGRTSDPVCCTTASS